jgi:hypothetical protein
MWQLSRRWTRHTFLKKLTSVYSGFNETDRTCEVTQMKKRKSKHILCVCKRTNMSNTIDNDGWTTVVGKRKAKKSASNDANTAKVQDQEQKFNDNNNDDDDNDAIAVDSKPILRHDGQKPIVMGNTNKGSFVRFVSWFCPVYLFVC